MDREWKSPRKIEEEIRQYMHERFEKIMTDVDLGKIEHGMAMAALEKEFRASEIVIGEPDAQP